MKFRENPYSIKGASQIRPFLIEQKRFAEHFFRVFFLILLLLLLPFQEDNNDIKWFSYSLSLFLKLERVAIPFFYVLKSLFLNIFLFSKIMVFLNIGILPVLIRLRSSSLQIKVIISSFPVNRKYSTIVYGVLIAFDTWIHYSCQY